MALTVGCTCIGYLVLLAVVFGGLLQPGERPAPGKADPLPGGTARHEHGVQGRAGLPAHSATPEPASHHTSRTPTDTSPAP
ncbi:hypothetical protein ACIQNI_14365 [Streptomyces sp. NPDC091266]|uniref:hypothetical protein n=1 Tax=unclassified Streptomyces TaxID=2593676 RepID=UPI00381DFE5B